MDNPTTLYILKHDWTEDGWTPVWKVPPVYSSHEAAVLAMRDWMARHKPTSEWFDYVESVDKDGKTVFRLRKHGNYGMMWIESVVLDAPVPDDSGYLADVAEEFARSGVVLYVDLPPFQL